MADLTREQVEIRKRWWQAKLDTATAPLSEEVTFWRIEVALCDLALIGLDAGEGWRERAAPDLFNPHRCWIVQGGDGFWYIHGGESGRNLSPNNGFFVGTLGYARFLTQAGAEDYVAYRKLLRALPSADEDQRGKQEQSSEARRELAPLEQEDTERASPAKGHTPALPYHHTGNSRPDTELARSHQSAERNQCDGCARGLPIYNGIHRQEDGMPVMACAAHLYESAAAQDGRDDRTEAGSNHCTNPASAADPEDSCYDHDEFRPSDYYEIPAAGQEQLATGASLAAPPAQPRGDLTWQEARERVLVKWPEARGIHADLRRLWYVWTDSPSSLSSFALCFAPTEAEAWLRAAKGL